LSETSILPAVKLFRVADQSGSQRLAVSDGRCLAEIASLPAGLEWLAPAAAPAEDAVEGRPLDPAAVRLLAPISPGKIVAIGLNYRDHIEEAGLDEPQRPLVFAKFPSSVIGPRDPIAIDAAETDRVDWEVELGVVIARRARRVAPAEALACVGGYLVANDVSARDVQFSDGQWVRGKSFDSFCPLGPALVTAEEIADPQALRLSTAVNGETVQDSSTGLMIFSVAEIIAFCSRSFTLEPGDLILTGTPWGCGEFMDPPRSLVPGDEVTCAIDGLGELANPVVAG
jgi:2-keto-4-pentenoate hydratase/2-oxohepta-3-ene-1,7-dioic acid hydratase in catechol pathway